ncbi:MAG TPA: 30S ribosomal protein S18 [Candidatus Paceibacterota bacterium]|jgi:small subunit ribosomal protein S18|nr:30S ribosomal protein S18 [Candidatus Paceibacterota bacterium]HRS47978.1 30S ribosomal protein S18 [Candidatus Paceibacterota bacterium]
MTNKQHCYFCGRGDVNYQDVETLKKFLSPSYKIKPREKTGLCSKHQRQLAKSVKLARQLALLPYLSE